MRKTILTLALAALLLVSCAAQENGLKTKDTDAAEKAPVSQIWDGYEALQGRQYGNAFTLPEKIEPVSVEQLYSFVPKDDPEWDKVRAGAETFFKAMYGSSFDSGSIRESVSPSGKQQIEYLTPDDDALAASSGIVYAYRSGGSFDSVSGQPELLGSYDPKKDRDVSLELEDGGCTVGELCGNVTEFLKEAFYPLYDGYELEPVNVSYQCLADMRKTAYVIVGIKRDGIFMEKYQSKLFEQEHRESYDVLTYYSFNQMDLTMAGADNILNFSNVTLISKMQEEPLQEIIPLTEAVKLLEASLAEQSGYVFETVELMYCQKFTYPALTGDAQVNSEILADYGEIPDQPFVPTWCFSWETQQGSGTFVHHIKVNAVTGEVTVDI